MRSGEPDPLAADIVHVREDRGDSAGAGGAGWFGCPDFRVKMFDKKPVDTVVGGEGLEGGSGGLNLSVAMRSHESLVLDL